jgi:hypothetical protein
VGDWAEVAGVFGPDSVDDPELEATAPARVAGAPGDGRETSDAESVVLHQDSSMRKIPCA